MNTEWFAGSKKGLEKIARRRGLSYVIFELVQNAWDTGAKEVKMTFEVVEGRPLCWVRIEDDDPDGFKDLAHAWTLFAESEKKNDPEKRGRFNLGEKLVLALCQEAEITSTKGNVRFDDEGRHVGRKRREKGTLFEGLVKMRRDELTELIVAARRLIPPAECRDEHRPRGCAPTSTLPQGVPVHFGDGGRQRGGLPPAAPALYHRARLRCLAP